MSALKIVWWVIYAICFIVALYIGIFVERAPLAGESLLIPMIVETLFVPVSLILIGFAMYYPNERLKSLAASLAIVSAILGIGFTLGDLTLSDSDPEGWVFIQFITPVPQVIYLYLYLSGKGIPKSD